MAIHPTALVAKEAELGADVDVGPFAVIGEGVVVGEGCRIGPHAVLHPGTALGARCAVHAHAVIGDTPQDLSFTSVPSRAVIGPDCVLREGVTVHRGTREDSETVVGKGCFLMANAHVAHNVVLGDRVILANGTLLGGYVRVGERAFLSGYAMVHQFVQIGRLAMMGGGSAATKDLPPFCIVRPLTMNRVAGLNVIGMRRAGLSPAERRDARRAFEIVYRSGLNIDQARARLRETFTGGPGEEFARFIDTSERGLFAAGALPDNGDEG